MKPYHRNPRQITKKRLDRLNDTLSRLGDLSGIVHNRRTDEIIGGNQRDRVIKIDDCEIVIFKRYDEPDEQGTVAIGYVVWQDKYYNYRLVDWDEPTAAEANMTANLGAGVFDWDIVANEWGDVDMTPWFNLDLLGDLRRDTSALNIFLASQGEELENDPYKEWEGMPEFEQEDEFGAVASIKVHFPTLADLESFAELVDQPINEKTTYIWFPKQVKENLKLYRVADES